jgi:ribulose 1,5-bisphosphate synthetase/thiazole synthase
VSTTGTIESKLTGLAELDGANRMGASFGGMLASGQKVRGS